jgi:hypothetical protein
MEDYRVTITGSTEEIEVLEQLWRSNGVATKRGIVSSYEGVAVTAFAIHATAPLEFLAQCIAAYGTVQGSPLTVSYFVPGKGRRIIKDYSLEAVADVLRQTQELCFERDNGFQ